MDKLDFEIVTPERLVLSETVDEVVLPGTEGYLGVLPGHTPLLSGLMPGQVSYKAEGKERFLAVSGGFAEVLPHRVTIVAQTAERAEEIDVARAERSRDAAERSLKGQADEHDLLEAGARLKRAVTRIQVAGHIR